MSCFSIVKACAISPIFSAIRARFFSDKLRPKISLGINLALLKSSAAITNL